VLDSRQRLLLCHATGTKYWDLPKGMRDEGETPLQAAQRELREETGLVFDADRFEEIGDFDYRPDKRLHLFKLRIDAIAVDQLICTSHFVHRVTGAATPEVDAFRWATRDEVPHLCGPRLARLLLLLDW